MGQYEPTIGLLGPIETAQFTDFLPRPTYDQPVPPGLGGTPVNSLALELLRRGRRVTLFSLDPSVDDERIIAGDRLRIVFGPFAPHRGRNWFARERQALGRAIARERPTVLHAHWTYEYALAASDSGLPHVVTAHDAPWSILRHSFNAYRLIRTVMAYQAGRRVGMMTAVSPYIAGHLHRYGFHRKPIRVIGNGIADPGPPPPRGVVGPVRIATISSGGWDRHRNLPAALLAFQRLRQDLPDARLTLIGSGCEPNGAAYRWLRSRGLTPTGIDFLGPLPHAATLKALETHDILLHPSLEESFSMVTLEAMSRGVAIVAGRNVGALPWLLEDGRCGMLVDVRKPEEIAAGLLHLVRDPARRNALTQAAYQSFRSHFSIGAIADAYEEIYATLFRA